MERKPHVAVVGGGVSGMTAAYRLARGGAEVTVLESTERIGGKLDTSPVAGVPVDSGAESVLTRRPEALRLLMELGLEERIAYPAPGPAAIYSRGRLRSFPRPHVMGVPGGIASLARSGVVSWKGVLRAAAERFLPSTPMGEDASVGGYVGARMGREVVDRLVGPLLGGVYAGNAGELSMESALPRIAPLARAERSLFGAARKAAAQQAAETSAGPAFATLRGGLAGLVDTLAKQADAAVETSAPVRELRTVGRGWQLLVGPEEHPWELDVDSVVLACPAPEAARLLRPVAPAASGDLAAIDYASTTIVTLAYPAASVTRPPAGSGFLVGPREGRSIKAATFSSTKWPWLAEQLRDRHPDAGMVLVRCSLAQSCDGAVAELSDEELTERVAADLAEICGVSQPPVDRRVTRWDRALPQYAVGHQQRIARVQDALSGQDGVALCGAAYEGVGIPACVASAERATQRILDRHDLAG